MAVHSAVEGAYNLYAVEALRSLVLHRTRLVKRLDRLKIAATWRHNTPAMFVYDLTAYIRNSMLREHLLRASECRDLEAMAYGVAVPRALRGALVLGTQSN